MLLYEQTQERGVPGVSNCSSGLARSLELVCTERIACLGMQQVEREASHDLIIMRVSFYWERRDIIDLSSYLLPIPLLTEVILLAALPYQ